MRKDPKETRAAILSCCIMFGLLMLMIFSTGCAGMFTTTKCEKMTLRECWVNKPCKDRLIDRCWQQ